MSTLKSSAEDLTLNADGSGNDIILQSNGSTVGSLTAEGVLTATSFAGSGASLTGLADNTPAFLAKPAIAQSSRTDNTYYEVDYTEVLDSDGCYASGRFTPAVVGYYQFNASAETVGGDSGWAGYIALYKNGSIDLSTQSYIDGTATRQGVLLVTSGVIYLDADDYIEVYIKMNTQGATFAIGTEGQFSAFRLIGV